MAETPQRIRTLVEHWPADRWERSYAPGKWTARQVVTHLAQTEMVLTTRVSIAVSQHDYVAQPFSQDESAPTRRRAAAAAAYAALRRLQSLDVSPPHTGAVANLSCTPNTAS